VEAVLVSNGPGELYTWVKPVLAELKQRYPGVKTCISLIPCQFASGGEARIAESFGADIVTTPQAFLRFMATGQLDGLGSARGFVVSLGGNTRFALKLAKRLGYPAYRYSFVPYWHPKLRKLFVHDQRAARKARLLGTPAERLAVVGNLVADAVALADPAPEPGKPHIVLIPGSRDLFARHLIPFMIAVADALGQTLPEARFVWPVSRLLSEQTIRAGIAGTERATLGGLAGERQGATILTPSGYRITMVAEAERYAHMKAAQLAITIPGTNTLELGIAGVPSLVILPLNRPELIPLEGPGHWLSLVPLIGNALKRQAVKLAAPRLPVSLPNSMTGEELMVEIKGVVSVGLVVAQATALLRNPAELARSQARLAATMPRPGAAKALLGAIMGDLV
jgi:lipid-A-disaccharide synthase